MMTSKLRRSFEIYENEGVISAFKASRDYLVKRCWGPTETIFWDWHGGQQDIHLGDVSIKIDATSERGGPKFRARHRTERFAIENLLDILHPDDYFYDIGANIGNYSCFAAKKIHHGGIIAFEPHPPNRIQLEKNLQYNRDTETLAEIFEVALSNEEGLIEFSSPSSDRPGVGSPKINPSGYSVKLRSVPGDQFISERSLPQPNVVKIDVEGAEQLVIEGLEKSLSNSDCRAIVCEVHLSKKNRPSEIEEGSIYDNIIEQLRALGFSIDSSRRKGGEVLVFGSK